MRDDLVDGDLGELLAVRAEIKELLAAALNIETAHRAEMEHRTHQHLSETERRDELHIAETDRRDQLHHVEILRRDDIHEHELDLICVALETRDVIGQAKGVIMASLGTTADEAFALIRQQSQHENRKLVEVAVEIANRASKPRAGRPERFAVPWTTCSGTTQRPTG